ncbi:hypothetical protein Pcinc_027701 [Petrolisthes cinctipes]|uniref:Uncharacterized protein n=1 Tax=Petrolisthes cinctipes TaxID=88211 RepID=A0AAE1F410_PETCI|nr:hypothetical protein Pcinc_027701 [Petrolisthes cinctipes]
MAGTLQGYLGPVLVVLTAVETALSSLGGLLWGRTKYQLRHLGVCFLARASDAYGVARRRASDAYEELQGKTGGILGGTYQVVQCRATEVYQTCSNRASLVYLQSHLRLSLALHRAQFQLSLLYQDVMRSLRDGLSVASVHKKLEIFRKWTNIKVTKMKKAAAKKAKVSLDDMSQKAKEYEDVMDTNLEHLSWSSSTERLLDDDGSSGDGTQEVMGKRLEWEYG